MGNVSPEKYQEMIEQLVLFLREEPMKWKKIFSHQMKDAAERMDFEEAARLRNQLDALKKLREQQRVAQGNRQ